MDINSLTIGQFKELQAVFNGDPKNKLDNKMIGHYVIVRCRDAGVHCGYLESYTGRECVLTECRRLWYWKVKPNKSGNFLNALALAGVHEDSKLSAITPRIHLTENCEIIQCTDEARSSLISQGVYSE